MKDKTYTEAEVRRMMRRAEGIAIEALRAVEEMYVRKMKELTTKEEK